MDSTSDSVIVFTGGDPVAADALVDLPDDAYIVAADSGLDHARRLGFRVDAAVGDFDSASPEAVEAARDEGTAIEVHPQAKDYTDFELALALAVARGPRRIVVVGGHGGRLDHLLGNALALTRPAAVGIDVEAITGSARLYVVAARRDLVGTRGELVTLLPVHGPARGVCTEGLRYPLRGETLDPGSTRGISNQFLGQDATVSVAHGLLLVVQPGEAGPPLALAPEEESS